eukprot:m.149504 g.149504  ORF g.149504 m.149504 type:complete len:50 (+) comp24432_c0_seq1:153-302(+)
MAPPSPRCASKISWANFSAILLPFRPRAASSIHFIAKYLRLVSDNGVGT